LESPRSKVVCVGAEPAEGTTKVGPRPNVADAPGKAVMVRGLTKRFGKLAAVAELDLDVAPGEVVGFLGPNGAGKTTTIRALMGFIRPSGGSCTVLGRSLAADVTVRSQVGYLPGDFRIDPTMTATDLFSWFARIRGGVDKRRLADLVERLQLEPDRPFGALSKGNRQKVGLVQAFMGDPQVLILDEPTSGLDPLIQLEFLRLVQESAARGAAVLFSSHVLPVVERVAGRVVIIRSGRLVSSGPVRELLDRARHRLELRFAAPVQTGLFDGVLGVAEVTIQGDTAVVAIDGPVGPAMAAALRGPDLLTVRPAGDDLEDLFVSIYSHAGSA
jgi:ABC-2 type transport system ATP-binding protein